MVCEEPEAARPVPHDEKNVSCSKEDNGGSPVFQFQLEALQDLRESCKTQESREREDRVPCDLGLAQYDLVVEGQIDWNEAANVCPESGAIVGLL